MRSANRGGMHETPKVVSTCSLKSSTSSMQMSYELHDLRCLLLHPIVQIFQLPRGSRLLLHSHFADPRLQGVCRSPRILQFRGSRSTVLPPLPINDLLYSRLFLPASCPGRASPLSPATPLTSPFNKTSQPACLYCAHT
jgi:hypothetical protein